MNRYLLDTNILVFLFGDTDYLSADVFSLINDTESLLYTNPICVGEFIHLIKSGKIFCAKGNVDVFPLLEMHSISVLPMTMNDFKAYAQLDISHDTNKDPNDHQIIAQSISTRIPLVSSDRKFAPYNRQGLKFFLMNASFLYATKKQPHGLLFTV